MRRTKHRTISAATARSALTATGTLLLLAGAVAPAQAQSIPTEPGVSVDLGVLEEMGPAQTVPDLLFPGDRSPTSRLLVPQAGATGAPPTLREPLMPTPGAMPQSRLNVPALQAPARQAAPRVTTPSPKARQETRPAPRPALMPATVDAPPMQPVANPPRTSVAPPAPVRPAPPPAPSPAPEPAAVIAPPPASEPPPAPPPVTQAPLANTPAQAEPTPTAPPPATTPPPAPAPEIQAEVATPPSAASAPQTTQVVTLAFEPEQTDLSPANKPQLQALAKRLQGNEALQVRVMAYAAGDGENASRARRTSLSRALTVRSFLMDQGIRSTRIEVRALGQPDSGPADRVDLDVFTP